MVLGRSAQALEELVDLGANAVGDIAEVVGNALHRAGAGAGVLGGGAHQVHFVSGVGRTLPSNFDAAPNLLRRRALLGDRGGDCPADVADFTIIVSIAVIASIERVVARCMSAICAPISSVARLVWPAAFLPRRQPPRSRGRLRRLVPPRWWH